MEEEEMRRRLGYLSSAMKGLMSEGDSVSLEHLVAGMEQL